MLPMRRSNHALFIGDASVADLRDKLPGKAITERDGLFGNRLPPWIWNSASTPDQIRGGFFRIMP